MDWLRRNRRKLAIGGGVIGGLYIVGRWVINLKTWLKWTWSAKVGWKAVVESKRSRDSIAGDHEHKSHTHFTSYNALQVERTRKANQFSATESTCRHTLASLMPTLVKQVTKASCSLLRRGMIMIMVQFWWAGEGASKHRSSHWALEVKTWTWRETEAVGKIEGNINLVELVIKTIGFSL